MTRKEYNKMIDEAINDFSKRNPNYMGSLCCLKIHDRHYITKVEIAKAKERIDMLKRLEALGLLK